MTIELRQLTDLDRLEQFIESPPQRFSESCVWLAVRLAGVARWLSTCLPAEQRQSCLVDFPQSAEAFAQIEQELEELHQELYQAVYASLRAQDANALRNTFTAAQDFLARCRGVETAIRSLLFASYESYRTGAWVDSAEQHEAPTRIVTPRASM